MRTSDERVCAVCGRVKELQRQKRTMRRRAAAVSSGVLCLSLVIFLSLLMPGAVERVSGSGISYAGLSGSVFYSGGPLSYIFIGLIAFILGVCATLLCIYLRGRIKHDKEDGND